MGDQAAVRRGRNRSATTVSTLSAAAMMAIAQVSRPVPATAPARTMASPWEICITALASPNTRPRMLLSTIMLISLWIVLM